MSGAAIVIVPTTAPAASPLMVQIVGTKTGCDVFNNVGGQTGDVPPSPERPATR